MAEEHSIIDEDNGADELKHEDNKDPKIPPISNAKELHSREQEHLKKLRKKIRVIDPASVYKYRHIKLSGWSSFFQVITLFVSTASVLLFNYYLAGELSSPIIEGVGEVSELTIIDKLSMYLPLFIIVVSFISLRKNLKKTPIPRYWLAMFSNSLNRSLLNNIKLFCYPLFLMLGSMITLEYYNIDAESGMASIFNGVIYDIVIAILSVLSVIIYYRAFRFCFKRL